MHKVIVAGSRGIQSTARVRDAMNTLWLEIGPFEVVAGGAPGVDRVAARLAVAAGIPLTEMHADWERWGKSAGYRRNEEMAKVATHLLAVWDGKSRGTKHMIELAYTHGLVVTIVLSEVTG